VTKHVRDEELELYALGGMPEAEAQALKIHVAECGECAIKLAQSRGTTALLSFATRQEQPAGTVKAELMARIHANREREQDYAWPVPGRSWEPSEAGKALEPEAKKAGGWWNWIVVPAALALAVLSLALSWQNRKVSQVLQEQRHIAQELIQEREETKKLVDFLAANDTVYIKLIPATAAFATGSVRYNARMGLIAYSAELPSAPAGKSYQMWVVPATGSPISAGVMEKGTLSVGPVWLAHVPLNTEARSFAVTVEPAGGAAQPTGAKVLAGTN